MKEEWPDNNSRPKLLPAVVEGRWPEVTEQLRETAYYTEEELQNWVAPLKPVRICENRLYLLCRDWKCLRRMYGRYAVALEFGIKKVFDTHFKVVFITEEMISSPGAVLTFRGRIEELLPSKTVNLIMKDYNSENYKREEHRNDEFPKTVMDIMDLIPSRDMKIYLQEIGYRFSDEEKLVVIHERVSLWEEQKKWLNDFMNTAGDEGLAADVQQYLTTVERQMDNFRRLDRNKEVYRTVLYYEDGSEKGVQLSYDYETAYQYGLQFSEGFAIEKLRISEVVEPVQARLELSEMSYDAEGRLFVPAPSGNEDEYPDIFDSPIRAPHPFKNGDIVEILPRYSREKKYYAVVNEGQEDQYYGNVEFTDFVVFVESYLPEDKEFGHDHVCPFDMEFCREPEMLEYPSILEIAQALITQSRRVTLEEFTMNLHSTKGEA